MKTSPRRAGAAGRIAEKQRKSAQAAAVAGLDPEYVSKLRHDSLVAAHKRLSGSGACPDEVVREAQQHFEASIRFLLDKRATQ